VKEEITDQELVQRTLAGDLDAFEEIVIRYQQAVFGVVFRLLRNQEEAEDIAQESFIKCYHNLDKFDQGRPFAPWICRIAGNLALSRLRQLKRRRFLPWEQVSFQVADINAVDPVASLEENEIKQEVADYIKKLKPLDQLVLILHYYKDFSYDEIAYIMHTKRNTIEVRLCRARKKLRQMFEQNQEVEKCSPAGK
jgi:RNA polymerase sigma-70 factor (ECF subfamily)